MSVDHAENHEHAERTEIISERFHESASDVDIQVTTARRFPRSIRNFQSKALSYATLDTETAESCFYVLERGDKPIKGPSVRLAEIVVACWGNIRSQSTVIDIGPKFVTAKGTCWDLENNTAVSVEVQRRITGKNGKRYGDDMIAVTSNAACAIALRNAIFKVVPFALVKPIYDKARLVAVGDEKTLADRRQRMVVHFSKMGVKLEMILAKVGKPSIEDFDLDDLEKMIGLSTAIRDGDTSVDEAFSEPQKTEPPTGTKTEQLARKVSEASQGEGNIPPEGDRRTINKTPQKETGTADNPEVITKKNHMEECMAYMKTEGVEPSSVAEDGSSAVYPLPNGESVLLTLTIPKTMIEGQKVVYVVEDDSFKVTASILDRARKQAARKQ